MSIMLPKLLLMLSQVEDMWFNINLGAYMVSMGDYKHRIPIIRPSQDTTNDRINDWN